MKALYHREGSLGIVRGSGGVKATCAVDKTNGGIVMNAEQKQTLIAKIESLPSEEQLEVIAHVDRLLRKKEAKQSTKGINLEELRGALNHLADEYTPEELQEKVNEWRIKNAIGVDPL